MLRQLHGSGLWLLCHQGFLFQLSALKVLLTEGLTSPKIAAEQKGAQSAGKNISTAMSWLPHMVVPETQLLKQQSAGEPELTEDKRQNYASTSPAPLPGP